jgi:GNAT superfamily N-acetyltransferase
MDDITIEPVRDGEVAGYLLGFVAPTGDGYIHFAGVRDDCRGLGLGRRLYEKFAAVAAGRGATGLKAITNTENEGSPRVSPPDGIHRHGRGGGLRRQRPDRIVMRRPLST